MWLCSINGIFPPTYLGQYNYGCVTVTPNQAYVLAKLRFPQQLLALGNCDFLKYIVISGKGTSAAGSGWHCCI
jgi:hypothetical protein